MAQPAGSPQNAWQEQWIALESQEKPAKEENGTNGKTAYINNVCDRHIISEFLLHSGQEAFGQRKGRAGDLGYS